MTGNHYERWPEAPDEDRVEQVVSTVDDPEGGAGDLLPVAIDPHEVDADEADLLEGAIPVPLEDDYPADGV